MGKYCGFPKIRGTFLGGSYNQGYNMLGSIVGFTSFQCMKAT